VLQAVFGPEQPRWESGRDADKAWLDLVLYSGETKAINLAQFPQAGIGLALEANGVTTTPRASALDGGGSMRLEWGNLKLSFPARPGRAGDLQKASCGEVK
jgi:hypothetical protein